METKRCYRCKQEKPLSSFGRDRRAKDGLNGCCRDCKKVFNEQYRRAHGVLPRVYGEKPYNHTEYMREYRMSHPESKERDRKYAQDYRVHHPGYNRKNIARYRAKQAGCSGVLTEGEICVCLDYFDHKCAYSGRDLPHDYHLDHVVPLAKGGENTIHNIVPCCPEINLNKRDHDFEEWYRSHATFDSTRLSKIRSWIEREG